MNLDELKASYKCVEYLSRNIRRGTEYHYAVTYGRFTTAVIKFLTYKEKHLHAEGPDFEFNLSVLYAMAQEIQSDDWWMTIYSADRSVGDVHIIVHLKEIRAIKEEAVATANEIIGKDVAGGIVDRFLGSMPNPD